MNKKGVDPTLDIGNLIALLSGVALFLFGMTIMGDGLKRVAGSRLEVVLYRLTSTPLKGVLLGTAVTAVIQSSSATSVMVVGFVNSGMMKFRQAIGIILGSILGTSITGWVVCLSYLDASSALTSLLSTATLTGVVAVAGIILRMFCKSQTKRHLGDILMGFAVLMFGMSAMSGAVEPLKGEAWFTELLVTFSNPLLGILVGMLFTAVLQSASAAVGIVQALSVTGALNFSLVLPLLLGISVGAAVPVLLSALGANVDGKRTALVYLVSVLSGTLLVGGAFYAIHAAVGFEFLNTATNPFSIALANSVLRLAMVVLLLPAIGLIEKLVCALIPEHEEKKPMEDATFRLEERFIQHPALAIEQSRLTINSMAELARDNLIDAMNLFTNYSDEGFEQVKNMESQVDRYEDKLGSYLVKVTAQEMTGRQNEEVTKFLHTISDFERISDHAYVVAKAAKEVHDKQIQFSEEGLHELSVLGAAVSEIVRLTTRVFVDNDLSDAARVEPLEEHIDDLCDEMKLHHIERLQRGECTLSQGFVFNDLVTNYERVGDHCSNVAVAMIELESDAFDTHQYLKSLKKQRTEAFDRYLGEYQARFAL